ncbi:DBH-like monooxygenase protein 2 [Rhinatrema bivittatum]|uniref:DBH-like monooxygenase protein 2 n=1 Tax=Rhinatrema bivittatum TaxID=194408 RepID=UPI00112C651B|nr:DBH-like monooxygenase protein 2 [Rhinatrema bivittatum]
MCMVFFYYYPSNGISSCDGQVNQTYMAEQLGVNASLPLVQSLANYSWDSINTDFAQKANRESTQMILITSNAGKIVPDMGSNYEIIPPERGACSNATYPVPGTAAPSTA